MTRFGHPIVFVGVAVLLTASWVCTVIFDIATSTLLTVVVSGLAVLGASFILAWGAETAEADVPRSIALAVLAVLAVAPEYAVDALYSWNAGTFVDTPRGAEAANLAVANMTGANRILIGLGWSGIALITVYRALSTGDPSVQNRPGRLRDVVQLDRDIATEISFLFLATMWALAVPLGGGIGVLDTAVLVGLYVAYIGIVIRSGADPDEVHVGVPAYFQGWSKHWRVLVVLAMFAYSGVMIFTAVEPFAHGLEELGVAYGIPSFFMIQWIAPLASESPELIVVAVLVNKARSTAGFNALISSKLNQWTLLIGTLAVIYSLALGHYAALPFDEKQAVEIWLTAAQSLFALSLLVNFEISVREALSLLVLFLSQVVVEFLLLKVLAVPDPIQLSILSLYVFTAVYVVLAVSLLALRREQLLELFGLAAERARTAIGHKTAVERAD